MDTDNAGMIENGAKELSANDYEVQLRQARGENYAARRECAKLKEDVALLEGREKMLEEDHRKEIAALQARLALSTSISDRELHQQNLDLSFKIEQMERDNAAVIESMAKELAVHDRAAIANDHEIQLRHAKREIHATRQECAKLKEDVALLEGREKMLDEDHRKEISAARQECIKLKGEVTRLEAREKAMEEAHRKELSAAGQECANLKEDVALLEGREKMLEEDHRKEITAARQECAKLKEDVALLEAREKTLEDAHRKEIAVLQARLGLSTSISDQELHQQNLDLSFKIEQMERDNAAMIENRARELAAQDRVAVAHDYEIQLRHAKREIHATRQECTKLKEDVALLEGREKMLDEDHRKEIAALQAKLDEAKQESSLTTKDA